MVLLVFDVSKYHGFSKLCEELEETSRNLVSNGGIECFLNEEKGRMVVLEGPPM